MKLRRILTILISCAGCFFASCTGDAVISNKFCSLPAYFSYTPVNAVSQLYTACNSMGEWSTITAVNNQYIFANTLGSTPVNKVKLSNYSGFLMGLSGFIVGLPNVPEVGSTVPVLTCYDLACSNCWHNESVTRKLTVQVNGKASCSKCKRIYDLNNIGQIVEGQAGINLYRYRVYYGNNTFTINNR